MNGFWVIAWNGFREARRNRVTVVIAVFAAVALLSSSLVTEVTVNTFQRVVSDFGLGTMSIILVVLAIFLSSGLLSREIERRTIFLIMSKPLSRGLFLTSRLAGNMLTLAILGSAMTAVLVFELLSFGLKVPSSVLYASLGLWFELLVLSSAGFLFSSFASQTVSAIATSGLYFAGHLSGDIYSLGVKTHSSALRVVAKAAYYVIPNLERVNLRGYAAYSLDVPAGMFWSGVGYACAYSAVLVAAAVLIFNQRDFR